MKDRLFLDTNIVLDLLWHRLPFFDGIAKIATLAEQQTLTLYVSALSFANAHYILSKIEGKSKASERLRQFRLLVNIISLDSTDIEKGLNAGFTDFEDALQYFSALKCSCHIILTRNAKDFKESLIPVMTAEEYLASTGKR